MPTLRTGLVLALLAGMTGIGDASRCRAQDVPAPMELPLPGPPADEAGDPPVLPAGEAPSPAAELPRATAARIGLRHTPERPLLGRDLELSMTFTVEDDAGQGLPDARLMVSSSAGTLEVIEPLGDGRFVATFKLPAVRKPLVILLAVADATRPGSGAVFVIPLASLSRFPVQTPPGLPIKFEVGGRWFGPFESDENGMAMAELEVPPGVTRARVVSSGPGPYMEQMLDLAAPPFQCLKLAPLPPLLADGQTAVPLQVRVIEPTGEPREGAPLALSAALGTVSEPVHQGAGLYLARYTPPRLTLERRETLIVRLLEGGPAQEERLEVLLQPVQAAPRPPLTRVPPADEVPLPPSERSPMAVPPPATAAAGLEPPRDSPPTAGPAVLEPGPSTPSGPDAVASSSGVGIDAARLDAARRSRLRTIRKLVKLGLISQAPARPLTEALRESLAASEWEPVGPEPEAGPVEERSASPEPPPPAAEPPMESPPPAVGVAPSPRALEAGREMRSSDRSDISLNVPTEAPSDTQSTEQQKTQSDVLLPIPPAPTRTPTPPAPLLREELPSFGPGGRLYPLAAVGYYRFDQVSEEGTAGLAPGSLSIAAPLLAAGGFGADAWLTSHLGVGLRYEAAYLIFTSSALGEDKKYGDLKHLFEARVRGRLPIRLEGLALAVGGDLSFSAQDHPSVERDLEGELRYVYDNPLRLLGVGLEAEAAPSLRVRAWARYGFGLHLPMGGWVSHHVEVGVQRQLARHFGIGLTGEVWQRQLSAFSSGEPVGALSDNLLQAWGFVALVW